MDRVIKVLQEESHPLSVCLVIHAEQMFIFFIYRTAKACVFATGAEFTDRSLINRGGIKTERTRFIKNEGIYLNKYRDLFVY